MSQTTVLETLSETAFFDGVEASHLERLAEISRPLQFPARHEIFHEHDTAKDVYIVVSGRVSLVICDPKVGCRQLMEVGAGELLGWSPLVGRPRLSDTAHTLEPTSVLAVDGERLLRFCHDDLEFGFQFMHRAAQVLAERLTATRLQLLQLSGFHLPDVQIESD